MPTSDFPFTYWTNGKGETVLLNVRNNRTKEERIEKRKIARVTSNSIWLDDRGFDRFRRKDGSEITDGPSGLYSKRLVGKITMSGRIIFANSEIEERYNLQMSRERDELERSR